MIITQPTLDDIPKLIEVTKACAKAMISKGVFQWNDNYPSVKVFENDIKLNQLWVLKEDSKLIGSIVVSSIIDEEYKAIDWLTPTTKNCYIHRLAVHPKYQGKGLAQQLMSFAETYAKDNKFISVRLDTFSINERNNIFYQKRGYQKLGDVFFPQQSNHPFHCYELVL